MTHEEVRYILNDLENEFDKDDERSIIAEALRMAIDAHEKQIPQKPLRYVTAFPSCCKVSKCSNCEQEFGFNTGFNYCENCGQAIDWSDTE